MLLETPHATDRPHAWLVPLAVSGAATVGGIAFPLVSPLLVTLVLGAVVANSPLQRRLVTAATASTTKLMLRLGIVLLGLRLSLGDIAAVGVVGVTTVLVTVAMTFKLTQYVGRRMGLEQDLVDLVAAGFSICGAAAVAAVQDSIGARQRNVALALALVTLFGTLMMLVIPALGLALGMGAEDTSLWVGASIHEVAQVVAATALVGGGSLAIAMSIKLGRVLMLVPVHHAVIRSNHANQTRRVGVPWFLWGFMAAVALRSTGMLPEVVLTAGQWGAMLFLSAGMYGLGLGLAVRDLWPVPPKALLLATFATSIVTTVPLVLITVF